MVVVLSIHASQFVIRPVIHPSKFLILKEEDDGMGGRRRLMAATSVYPHVHVIMLAQFVLALR